jgi:hypothetical protein
LSIAYSGTEKIPTNNKMVDTIPIISAFFPNSSLPKLMKFCRIRIPAAKGPPKYVAIEIAL